MSFSVQVTPDLVPLEPGVTTPISVVVVNKGTETDRFEMELEGIDSEWKAVPVAVFDVDPSETHSEKIFLKPGRTSESLAGNYPFVVKVRSLNSGEQRSVQGVAEVKAFHHLSLEINPKKGFISPTKRRNAFSVTVVNLGNTEHTLQLVGTDPEDACAFEFDPDQVNVVAGQQKDVSLIANPTDQPFFSGGHLIGFTVTARSVDSPAVAASAQGQLEQRPVLTPTSLAVIVLLALILGALYWVMPRPPTLALNIDRNAIEAGQSITVSWDSEHAKHVEIRAGDDEVYAGSDPRGTRTVTLTTPGNIVVHAEARSGDQREMKDLRVDVTAPPEIPLPHIGEMKPTPTRVKVGQPFTLRYKLSDSVTQAFLEPMGTKLDKALDSIQVTPTEVGEIEYTVVVENSAGVTEKRSFKITVYEESDAQILDFHPSAKVINATDGKVTLYWQVTNAARVEIKEGDNEPLVVDPQGPRDFPMSAKTTFMLTAIDAQNRRRIAKVTVGVLPPPDSTEPPGTLAPGTNPTTTTTGATTAGESTGNTTGGIR
jgi:hypothetical protein